LWNHSWALRGQMWALSRLSPSSIVGELVWIDRVLEQNLVALLVKVGLLLKCSERLSEQRAYM
jgi:hypothetical protein